MVIKRDFFGYDEYILETDRLTVSVITLGATVRKIVFKGRNIVLGYDTAEEYLTTSCYPGVIAGRYANRIKNGKININGKEYSLDKNNGANHLHGGFNGSDKKTWMVSEMGENYVLLECTLADGECGYPGNLKMGAKYTVAENRLRIDFYGESDADTIYAPTTHTYFNLGSTPTVQDTVIRINAEEYVAVDDELIPTEVKKADGIFDFKNGKTLNENYDHCFILKEGKNAFSAEVGGIKMSFDTDFPAVQLYTGEFLKDGFLKNSGFAAEPEYCPDSPNRPEFVSPLLKKGERFCKYIEYRFNEE